MSKLSPLSATIDILNGHLGNLTADQERQLESFKVHLATSNVYIPADTEDGGKKASHDDPTLLYVALYTCFSAIDIAFIRRFLRARNWDVAAAQEQFTQHQEWLKKHDVRRVLNDLTPEDFRHTQKFYPRWTGRRDKVCIAQVSFVL
jgi:hypothetical protein